MQIEELNRTKAEAKQKRLEIGHRIHLIKKHKINKQKEVLEKQKGELEKEKAEEIAYIRREEQHRKHDVMFHVL